jgi:hypothetical protein
MQIFTVLHPKQGEVQFRVKLIDGSEGRGFSIVDEHGRSAPQSVEFRTDKTVEFKIFDTLEIDGSDVHAVNFWNGRRRMALLGTFVALKDSSTAV